jgi:phage protein D
MSRSTPVTSLLLDGQRLSGPEAALLRAEVALGLGPAHDCCRLELHAAARSVPALGARVGVALGFDGSPQDVFSGTVTRVERRSSGALLECHAPSWQLSRRRAAQVWVGQGATQIVRDLLSDAGVDAGIVGADLDLGVFHADDRRSRWAHLLRLAELAGCEVASTADGALNVRPPRSGPSSTTLRRGAELLSWRACQVEDAPEAAPVGPAGAGSEAGADHWHLPLASPAGDSPAREAWVPGSVRDRNAARTVAKARSDAAKRRSLQGEACCWGQPALRPGDRITLADLPGGDVEARLTAVTQVLDASGFATWLDFEGVA